MSVGKIAEMAPASVDTPLIVQMTHMMSTSAVHVMKSYAAMANVSGEEVDKLSAAMAQIDFMSLFTLAKNGMLHVTQILNSGL